MATESRAGSGKRGRPYGGLTPDERRQDRRQRLIEAGLQEFGTVGYADTSIETLCRSAKVTPRYFYEFFASRERVLAAVYDRTSIEVLAGVSDAVSRAGSDGPAAMIRAGTGSFFSQLFEDPRKARILCVDSVGVSAEIEQSRRVCMHQFARLVSERGRLVLPGDDLPMDLFDIVARLLRGRRQ